MPIPSSVPMLEIASAIAEHVLKRGGWPDCTPEKILERASSYEELHKWRSVTLPDESAPVFPRDPKPSQVIYITQNKVSYCYVHIKGAWKFSDSMPVHLRYMI